MRLPDFECYHYYDAVPPEIEFHDHQFYEILLFLSGNVSYTIEGRTYQLRPGDILLTSRGALYVSKSHLNRSFKDFSGLTLYQYIIKKRLVVARDMLLEGQPVMDACMKCGFNDYSNFLKAFKREFGKSPREFMARK